MEAGNISQVLIPIDSLDPIRAESSWAVNLGIDVDPTEHVRLRVNLFWNDVNDLIETAPVARRTNGQSVFTYFNMDEVFTRGAEAELRYRFNDHFNISAGYQIFMKSILYLLVLVSLLMLPVMSVAENTDPEIGFLVIAPDRGFMGNEEIRDAFETFSDGFNTSLVFITREEATRFLKEGIQQLENNGTKRLVVIPLFLSDHHPLYRHAQQMLESNHSQKLTRLSVKFAETMSHSYLTAEILADRIDALSRQPEQEALVVVATGASSKSGHAGMERDLKHVLSLNNGRYPFAEEIVFVFDESGTRSQASQRRLEEIPARLRNTSFTPVLIPLDFTQKLDGMMSFTSRLASIARKHGAAYNGRDLTPHPNVGLWLLKQANRFLPITRENLGVVYMPHGSDYNWNRTMIDAIAVLQKKYMIEPAFSMADPHLIARAVKKLEQRGARTIVVVRVFSLKSSFREVTE